MQEARINIVFILAFDFQYPEQIMLKYPKVGTANPTIQLMVRNLDEDESKPVLPPSDVPDEHIYTAVTWITQDELSVIWTNRVQNESRWVKDCLIREHTEYE